ncbi:hypothetical protein IJT93_12150 [bacterium]|nr:hypothetical protein [bacterium]
MNEFTADDIIKKLEATLADEGLKITSFAFRNGSKEFHISMQRFAPGLPTAFMVKGLQGTFRRYLDPQISVVLDGYEVLPDSGERPSHSSEELKSAILNGPAGNLQFENMPLLKFSVQNNDRHAAAEALENFVRMIKRRGLETFAADCPAEAPLKVLKQWCAINRAYMHRKADSDSLYIIHGEAVGEADREAHEASCCRDMKFDILPADILVMTPKSGK